MELTQQDFDGIRAVIQKISGLAIPGEKLYLVKQRLESLACALGCRSFSEFLHKITHDCPASLREALIAAITTNETYFFRDEHPFLTFAEVILPSLERQHTMLRRARAGAGVRPRIRIWSAACSTGQEPYSIAMLIREHVSASRQGLSEGDFEIIASDISAPVLDRAKAGEYSDAEITRGLPAAKREAYFHKQNAMWKVNEWLRSRVEFRRINLIEPLSYPGRLDMIFCRNALIYFDHETKRRIVNQFHANLADQGLLLIGASESLYNITDRFESVRIGQSLCYAKKASNWVRNEHKEI